MNFDARRYVLVIFILLVGIFYSIRLFYMQVIDDQWKLRAQDLAEKRKEIVPARAIIYDRNAQKIVSNRTFFNLMMLEDKIENLDTLAFASLIGWPIEKVRARFKEIILDDVIVCVLTALDSKLIIGQTIVVKGRVIGYDDLMGNVNMDQCSINN